MRMMSWWMLGLMALSPILAGGAAAGAAEEAEAKQGRGPNIVLMMADDLGWGDVGFNGNRVIRTPHLDAMATNGLVFRRFYAASAVCSPTRGACLTGRHPYRYGIPFANTGHMKPPEITLAELLRERGDATGHFGKWHLGTLTTTMRDSNRGRPGDKTHFAPPWENGFDRCFSTEAKVPTWDPMLKPTKGASGRGWTALEEGDASEPYGTHYFNERGEVVQDNLRGDDSRVIMDRVIPFVESSAGAGKPFFAVVWFHTPHLPVVAGPKHAAMYADAAEYERNYYGCVTAMDEQVGRLRAALRELGVADNTMLVMASDNGPEGNDEAPGTTGGLRGRKRSLYEGGVRVPGVIEWPARIRPGVTDFPAVTSDYLPTILEAVGAPAPDARPIDGVSLVPVFADATIERSRPIGFEIRRSVALIDNRYKLISNNGGGTWELYDLLEDRGERHNIAASHEEIVARMRATVEQWRASCAASAEGKDY